MRDCKLHIILIINDNKNISRIHFLNKKAGSSPLYKIDELNR